MLSNLAKLVAAFAVLTLAVTSADAQQIHPECAKRNFRDKIGCTCALQNGGTIVPRQGGGWRWVHRSGYQSVNEGYVACMKRHGRG